MKQLWEQPSRWEQRGVSALAFAVAIALGAAGVFLWRSHAPWGMTATCLGAASVLALGGWRIASTRPRALRKRELRVVSLVMIVFGGACVIAGCASSAPG